MTFNKLLLLLILIIIIHPFLCNVILRALSKIEKFFLKVGARQMTVASNTQNLEPTTSSGKKRQSVGRSCVNVFSHTVSSGLCLGPGPPQPSALTAKPPPKWADTSAESWGTFTTDNHKELCRVHLTYFTSSFAEVRYQRGGLTVMTSSPALDFSSMAFILTKHFYMQLFYWYVNPSNLTAASVQHISYLNDPLSCR